MCQGGYSPYDNLQIAVTSGPVCVCACMCTNTHTRKQSAEVLSIKH